VSGFQEARGEQNQADLSRELRRLTAAHITRNADGGYLKAGGYQHHARVIRQMSTLVLPDHPSE
jgi:arginine repressor